MRVAVTGAGGQLAYSLLFRIAAGDLFGPQEEIILHLLDLPESLPVLKGVEMELHDSAFPLLKEVRIGTHPDEMFAGVDWALLIGAKPRGPNMERKDLLAENGKIFLEQGKALGRVASKKCRVLVVGNPCNTNCLIAQHAAKELAREQFFAMTRLDQNRAQYQLAKRAGVPLTSVSRVSIWGNHSSTLVPDFLHARIGGRPAHELVERGWLQGEFLSLVQKRGAQVIAARGKSSAASAAQAILDTVRSLHKPSEWFSLAVSTASNPYGIQDDLFFSFPCRSHGGGKWEILSNLSIEDSHFQEKLKTTERELIEERDLVRHLLYRS